MYVLSKGQQIRIYKNNFTNVFLTFPKIYGSYLLISLIGAHSWVNINSSSPTSYALYLNQTVQMTKLIYNSSTVFSDVCYETISKKLYLMFIEINFFKICVIHNPSPVNFIPTCTTIFTNYPSKYIKVRATDQALAYASADFLYMFNASTFINYCNIISN